MEHSIHITKTPQGWAAKCSSKCAVLLASENKNAAVLGAIAAAKRLYGKAIVFIHGIDGRILEERNI